MTAAPGVLTLALVERQMAVLEKIKRQGRQRDRAPRRRRTSQGLVEKMHDDVPRRCRRRVAIVGFEYLL